MQFFLYRTLPIFLLLFFSLAKNAYAYIDPGTGSYILQILIGILLGALFAFKLAWRKILDFFKAIYSKMRKQRL